MVNVTSLASHILGLEPEKDPARLCFYNYLKNLCEPMELVTPELLNRFFARALLHSHWRENKSQLFTEAQMLLRHYSDTFREEFDSAGVLRSQDLQAFPVESLGNLQKLVNKWLLTQLTPHDQFKVFQEGKDRVVAVVMMADKSLRIASIPAVLALQDGEIFPLCTDFGVLYDSKLNLDHRYAYHLDLGAHLTARFRMGSDGCRGVVVRGYTFQRYAVLDGGSLQKYPVLFYPFKRLEQFFINRATDPMYLELISSLEKALDLLRQGDPGARVFSKQAVERGRLAFERIFPDDRMLRLLIDNLEKTLALEEDDSRWPTNRIHPQKLLSQ